MARLWFDELLLGWIIGGLTILGCLIVSLPDLVDSWAQQIRRGEPEDD